MFRTGLVLCVLLGLLDVVGSLPLGGETPPVGVIIAGLVLGLVTLAAAYPALRGNRAALITVIGSRALSALLGIGAFFDDRAPSWVKVAVVIAFVLTAVAVWLLAPALRARRSLAA